METILEGIAADKFKIGGGPVVRMNVGPLQNIFTCHNASVVDVCSENLHPVFVDMQFKVFSTSFEDRIAAAVTNVTAAVTNVTAAVTNVTDSFLYHWGIFACFLHTFMLAGSIWMVTNLLFFAFGIEFLIFVISSSRLLFNNRRHWTHRALLSDR